ncbi:hypothetical protein [Vagococcus proximus]|nr:hypothetical protein [Vagococcus proximus]
MIIVIGSVVTVQFYSKKSNADHDRVTDANVSKVSNLNTDEVRSLYDYAIKKDIIDPKKYLFSHFVKDEKNRFRNMYEQFKKDVDTKDNPVSYRDWLEMNNFGVMPDTKESIYDF